MNSAREIRSPRPEGRGRGLAGKVGGGPREGENNLGRKQMRYAILALALTGCATSTLAPIDYGNPPPADWPRLKESISRIQHADMTKYCKYRPEMAAGSVSCAVINFRDGTCSIYLTERSKSDALHHEREHCRGYDHVGDLNRSRNAWERWKKAKGL